MNKNTEHLNVWFNVGHDDRSYTTPRKRYIGTVSTLSDTFKEDSMVDKTDENGEPLPDSEWKLLDRVGNIILQGREEIEEETGIIDWGSRYDIDIVRNITECDPEEYQCIIDAYNDGEYVDDDVLRFACEATSQCLVLGISFNEDGSMDVRTQYRTTTFVPGDVTDETDARDTLKAAGFIKSSIESIVDAASDECWFDFDEEDED